MRRTIISWAAIASLCLASVFAFAAGEKPDATIQLETGSFAVGIGFSWGDGHLNYQGKSYPVSVSGLSVGDVGITSATAAGEVYHLKKLEDFNGTYTAFQAGLALGGGVGASAMKNENGVVIKLIKTSQGFKVALAAAGVKLQIKQ